MIRPLKNCVNCMNNYIIATIRKWNIELFQKKVKEWGDNWHLITNKDDLNVEFVKNINPKYIFFPHWSWIIPKEIYENYECIGFHCTELPYGRGGSPLQNMIIEGKDETRICAFRIQEGLDTGNIYCKEEISLRGLAEEIYIKMSQEVAEMIKCISKKKCGADTFQAGKITLFKRRTPEQSEILNINNLDKLFDHIRMLDAEGYPRAFINYGDFKLTFSRPALRTGKIVCDVEIKGKE